MFFFASLFLGIGSEAAAAATLKSLSGAGNFDCEVLERVLCFDQSVLGRKTTTPHPALSWHLARNKKTQQFYENI